MTDKDKQLKEFRAAVARKAEAADADASAGQPAGPPPRDADPSDGGADAAGSPRQKNERKGGVTADKWNQ
jgi:hypothetical protein